MLIIDNNNNFLTYIYTLYICIHNTYIHTERKGTCRIGEEMRERAAGGCGERREGERARRGRVLEGERGGRGRVGRMRVLLPVCVRVLKK